MVTGSEKFFYHCSDELMYSRASALLLCIERMMKNGKKIRRP